MTSGDSVTVSFILYNPCDYDIDFNHSQFPIQVYAVVIKREETYIQPVVLSEPVGVLYKGQSLHRTLKSALPDIPPGTYQFGISLSTRMGPTLNSIFVKIIINSND